MDRPGPVAEHTNLPAPYESPWRQLGQALRAVVASLGLDLRQLWRRNRSGQLWQPAFWPRSLSSLFWPLLLSCALAGVVVLGLSLHRAQPAPAPPQPEPLASVEPALTSIPDPSEGAREDMTRPDTTQPGHVEEPTQRPEALALPPALAALDPLLEQLGELEGRELISAAHAQAALGRLQLKLSAAFGQLDPKRQHQLAEAWLTQSERMGFDQLELVDDLGQPLGYQARVGSGMILLDSAATS